MVVVDPIGLATLKLWKQRLFVMPDIVGKMGNPVGEEIHFAESLTMLKDSQEGMRVFSGFAAVSGCQRKTLENQCFSIFWCAEFDTKV